MSTSVRVSGQLVSAILRYADLTGVDLGEVKTNLLSAHSKPRIEITHWWSLLEETAPYFSEGNIGIYFGLETRIEDAGILGHLAASCQNLGEALNKARKYEALLHNLSYTRIAPGEQGLSLTWQSDSGVSTPISNEMYLAGLLTLCRSLVGDDSFSFLAIEFPHPPLAPIGDYRSLLGCPVTFSSSTLGLQVSNESLSLPIDSNNPHLRQILEQQADSMIANLPQPDTFLKEVQQHMLEGLSSGFLTANWLASRLSTSERQLFRKFSERGISYQGVLDKLREELAKRYVIESNLRLVDISLILGFSEQSAFARAFKKWTGMTVTEFRKSH